MFKKHKRMILITSVVILLPILVGMLLWTDLPDTMATHFGVDNQPDGWNSKAFAVFGLPCIVLAIHWIAVLATCFDPKSKNIHEKMMNCLLWICPSVSLVLSAVTYSVALGAKPDVGFIIMLLFGVLFILLGNYLPKCRQNHSLGIRTPWTLRSEKNWSKTHRVAGWSMSIGGVAILLTAFFRSPWLFFAIILIVLLLPFFCSFAYDRKQHHKEEQP